MLGSGGVSLFALQFTKVHGPRVLITSSSDDKLQRARALGAGEVLRLTGGRGVDLVLETGGTATFPQSIQSAALDSTIFIIGFLSGTDVSISVVPVMERRLHLQGNNTGPVTDLTDAAMAVHKQTSDRRNLHNRASRGSLQARHRKQRRLRKNAISIP